MTETDREPFAAAITALAVTFAVEMARPRLEAYWLALSDVPLEAVQRAVQAAMRACRFFPTPAELREFAGCGLPDAGLIEAHLTAHFRCVAYPPRAPAHPFLRLVCERLGGVSTVAGLGSLARLQAVRAVLPALTATAQARGIPVLTQDVEPGATALRLAPRAELAASASDTPEALAVQQRVRQITERFFSR